MSSAKSHPEQFHIPNDTWKSIRDIYGYLMIFLAQGNLPRKNGNGERTEPERLARIKAFDASRAYLLRKHRTGEVLSPKEKQLLLKLQTADELEIVRGMLRAFWSSQPGNGTMTDNQNRWETILNNKQSSQAELQALISDQEQQLRAWSNYRLLEKYLIHLDLTCSSQKNV